MALLELENVTRRFGGVVALDDVSFSARLERWHNGRWISFGGLLKACS